MVYKWAYPCIYSQDILSTRVFVSTNEFNHESSLDLGLIILWFHVWLSARVLIYVVVSRMYMQIQLWIHTQSGHRCLDTWNKKFKKKKNRRSFYGSSINSAQIYAIEIIFHDFPSRSPIEII